MTPEDVRFGEMVNKVIERRKAGESDAAIRAFLSMTFGLSKLHPCADRSGMNICSKAEIDRAIGSAQTVAVEQEKAKADEADGKGKGATVFTTRNLMIAGGIAAIFIVMKGKK